MKRTILAFFLLLSVTGICLASGPKREFRGAWIQAVNHQFEGVPTQELKQTLSDQLDSLQAAGINTILFQVRVEADALYKSSLEPWSAFLTGRQGQAPDEDWDPLRFMIDQCHSRDMELHAWINPFRAKTTSTTRLAANHQASLHPERMVRYGGLTLFNPGLKENRDYICSIAADIVTRYDIDGFHIDDYFYPYPEDGLSFNDNATFRKDPRGFSSIGDWRRDNISLFIEQLYETIKQIKPWVKFGISPFGIYRNQSEAYPAGSETNGFESYSGLYADILLWIRNGWVDYCIPQVYWNTGFKKADYSVLTEWWSKYGKGCLMYIGQDVERTVSEKDPADRNQNQERHKLNLQRSLDGLSGSCFWPALPVVNNIDGFRTVLSEEYYNTPALQPVPKSFKFKAPGKVRKLMVVETSNGPVLFWTAPKAKRVEDYEKACRYVVYRFEHGQSVDLDDTSCIVAITRNNYYEFNSAFGEKEKATYVVTALNRSDMESDPVRCKVSLQ